MTNQAIQNKIELLPDQAREEVIDFIDFLVQKYGKSSESRGWRFDWEGALADLKEQYTSVELQHKAAEWR